MIAAMLILTLGRLVLVQILAALKSLFTVKAYYFRYRAVHRVTCTMTVEEYGTGYVRPIVTATRRTRQMPLGTYVLLPIPFRFSFYALHLAASVLPNCGAKVAMRKYAMAAHTRMEFLGATLAG